MTPDLHSLLAYACDALGDSDRATLARKHVAWLEAHPDAVTRSEDVRSGHDEPTEPPADGG